MSVKEWSSSYSIQLFCSFHKKLSLFLFFFFYLTLFAISRDYLSVADSLNSKIVSHIKEGNITKATAAFNNFKAIIKSKDDSAYFFIATINMAELYRLKSLNERAYQIILSGQPLIINSRSNFTTSRYYNRKAAIEFQLEMHDDAQESVLTAIKYGEKSKTKVPTISNLTLLGAIYREIGEEQKALNTFKQVLTLTNEEALKDKALLIELYFNIARAYQNINQLDSALKFGLMIEELNPELTHNLTADNFRLLADIQFRRNEFKEAYEFLLKSNEIRLQSLSEINKNALENINREFELEASILRNTLLESENKKSQLYIILGLICIFLLALMLVFFRYRQHYFKNLSEKEKRFSSELQKNQDLLEENIQFQKKLHSIIAHDLRSPIANLDSLIQYYNDEELSDEELKSGLKMLSKDVSGIQLLIENLLQLSASQGNEYKIFNQKFNVSRLIYENVRLFEKNAENKSIVLDLAKVDENISLKSDYNLLSMVFRNLLDNSIKFTEDGGKVTVKAFKLKNNIQIEIIDNGIGMPKDKLANIFDSEPKTSRGTANEKGSGLGLKLCNEVIQKLSGKLEITSDEGKGTTCTILVPDLNQDQALT